MAKTNLTRITAVWVVSTTCTVSAQTEMQGESVDAQLKSMQQELNSLRFENQSMRDEIDELRAKSDDNWMTEARATEIRGLVEDVLADADTRASLLDNGLMAGWSDHFFLASMDGRFKLALEGQLQVRFVYNRRDFLFPSSSSGFTDEDVFGFENTRTQLTFRGHVFNPDLEYFVKGNFNRSVSSTTAAGVLSLSDAWVRYHLNDNWSIQIGQFKLPFNREELVSSQHQLAIERSSLNELTNLGRSQGIQLIFHDDVSRWSLAFSDGATITIIPGTLFVGPTTNTTHSASDTEYAVTTRYERLIAGSWEQFVDFTSPPEEEFGMLFGIGLHAEQSESTGAISFGRNETRLASLSLDLSVEWGGANGFVSLTHTYVDAPLPSPGPVLSFYSIVAQTGIYVTPKWEVFLRGEHAFAEGDISFADLGIVTAGVNYYLEGHDVKWSADVGLAVTPVDGPFVSDLTGFRRDVFTIGSTNIRPDGQFVFRTQLQLLF